MPLQNMQEVEVFDYWGIDFAGLLPSLHGNEYILVIKFNQFLVQPIMQRQRLSS